jgi:hypothetical protein
VHEAKRFTRISTSVGRAVEYGVAVRILAAADEISGNVQLTLPNLAADAQLAKRDARIALQVVGYSGALGEMLPSPRRLDVESLATYLESFGRIQQEVFGAQGLRFLTPTLLAYDEDAPKP